MTSTLDRLLPSHNHRTRHRLSGRLRREFLHRIARTAEGSSWTSR
jgi:hypothetical protein